MYPWILHIHLQKQFQYACNYCANHNTTDTNCFEKHTKGGIAFKNEKMSMNADCPLIMKLKDVIMLIGQILRRTGHESFVLVLSSASIPPEPLQIRAMTSQFLITPWLSLIAQLISGSNHKAYHFIRLATTNRVCWPHIIPMGIPSIDPTIP